MAGDFFSNYMTYALIPSIVIVGILAFLQTQRRNKCGFNFPSLLAPMRFLDGFEERWSYALCFGAITSIIIGVFFQTAFTGGTDSNQDTNSDVAPYCDSSNSTMCAELWVKTLLLQGQSLVASFVCIPHFLCISTPYKLVGALMGFAYSAFWIVFYIAEAVRNEKYYDKTVGSLLVLQDMPIMLCFAGLCIRSVWACYWCYMTKSSRVQIAENVIESHQVNHVTSLFRKLDAKEPPEGFVDLLKYKWTTNKFPHFKLPTRIICIAFVQVIIIYYMGMGMTILGVELRRILHVGLESVEIPFNFTHDFSNQVVDIFEGVYVTASVIGLLTSVIYIALFVINYRFNMVTIYRGNKHLYASVQKTSAQLVARSLRLPGYQIAYILWGFIILFLVVFFFLFIVCFFIYILQLTGNLDAFFYQILQTISVPLQSLAIFYIQVLLVRFVLLQPKVNKKDKDPPLNIDNRKVYEVVSYLLVFMNLVVGLASALFRTLKSFFLGLIFLGRLDRCLLMKGFESMDPGYMAYVGALLVDNAHNNPVMRTFCALLIRLNSRESDKEARGIRFLREPDKVGSNSRGARRWHLAYTLLHNPSLLPRRKLALLLTRGMENKDDNDDDNDKRTPPPHPQPRSTKSGKGASPYTAFDVPGETFREAAPRPRDAPDAVDSPADFTSVSNRNGYDQSGGDYRGISFSGGHAYVEMGTHQYV